MDSEKRPHEYHRQAVRILILTAINLVRNPVFTQSPVSLFYFMYYGYSDPVASPGIMIERYFEGILFRFCLVRPFNRLEPA